jgi:FkbM family methyltransferase
MIKDNGWYRHESDTALRDKLADDFPIGDNDASLSLHQKILDDLNLSNKRTSIDIGAYTGAWSTVLSKDFKTVHAFEPSTTNCACFRKNTKDILNIKLHKVVISHRTSKNVTLSDGQEYTVDMFLKDGEQIKQGEVGIMELTDAADYSSSRFVRLDKSEEMSKRSLSASDEPNDAKIPMKEIDEYNFTDVDLINLHTNGSEYLAIMGAIDTIQTHRPAIIYQVYEDQMSYYDHGSDNVNWRDGVLKTGEVFNTTPTTIDEFITSLGYSITTVNSFEKWGMTYRIAVPD